MPDPFMTPDYSNNPLFRPENEKGKAPGAAKRSDVPGNKQGSRQPTNPDFFPGNQEDDDDRTPSDEFADLWDDTPKSGDTPTKEKETETKSKSKPVKVSLSSKKNEDDDDDDEPFDPKSIPDSKAIAEGLKGKLQFKISEDEAEKILKQGDANALSELMNRTVMEAVSASVSMSLRGAAMNAHKNSSKIASKASKTALNDTRMSSIKGEIFGKYPDLKSADRRNLAETAIAQIAKKFPDLDDDELVEKAGRYVENTFGLTAKKAKSSTKPSKAKVQETDDDNDEDDWLSV